MAEKYIKEIKIKDSDILSFLKKIKQIKIIKFENKVMKLAIAVFCNAYKIEIISLKNSCKVTAKKIIEIEKIKVSLDNNSSSILSILFQSMKLLKITKNMLNNNEIIPMVI